MQDRPYKTAQRIVSAAGLALMALLFVLWARRAHPTAPELAAALLCVTLFTLVCLRFVPQWFFFWFGNESPAAREGDHRRLPVLFLSGVFYGLFNLEAVYAALRYVNPLISFADFKAFWTSADAYHYLCIAEDWYLSEGILDRLVQLVFLPGYPIAVRLMHLLVPDYIFAGILVSTICFSGALCVLYLLLCLDYEERTARRALLFLCLMPGAFFFFAPMSESLFLLLCVSCVYCARKEKWLLAGFFGALAAFTRSLGLMLFVPLFFEIAAQLLHGNKKARRGAAALLLVPLGFAAYCFINYRVAGNPFQFMIYQREHWSQQLGLFFNTAAYQTRYALHANREMLMGLWLPNLAAIFGALLILLFGVKRLRPSYTAWALAYFVIAIGATWLLSAPRYLAALPPLPISLAALGERKAVRIPLLVLFALAELYYLVMFALRCNVW